MEIIITHSYPYCKFVKNDNTIYLPLCSWCVSDKEDYTNDLIYCSAETNSLIDAIQKFKDFLKEKNERA